MNRMRSVTPYLLGIFLLLALSACAASGTSRSTGTYLAPNPQGGLRLFANLPDICQVSVDFKL